jgi:uncharacterized protein
MKRIPVEVTGITTYPPYQGYMLILRETDGLRWLPIFIGQPEAQNISHILKGSKSLRPLTFDMIANMMEASGVRVEEVIISELRDSTFFAEVVLRLNSGGVRQADARPSDAIALALRMRAPIFVTEKVIVEAGQTEESLMIQPDTNNQMKDLNQLLQNAVEQEAYEEAARIRDRIRTLETQGKEKA